MIGLLDVCGEPAAVAGAAGFLIGAALTAGIGLAAAARAAVRETEQIVCRRKL